MFELLKVFIEKIVSSISIPAILEWKKKQELTKIGTELFLLYIALNEIYVTGVQIAEALEKACEWTAKKQNAKRDQDRSLWSRLHYLVPAQNNNLRRFLKSFTRLEREFQVVDAESYRLLYPLIVGKATLLFELLHSFNSDSIRSYTEEAIADAVKIAQESESLFDESWQRALMVGALEFRNFTRIDISRHDELSRYLERSKPRERLKSIEAILGRLRESLEKNFSTQEILLAIGDRRAAPVDPYDAPWW